MVAWTASTAFRTACDGSFVDTAPNCSTPSRGCPRCSPATDRSGPVLDPTPKSLPHRLEMVENAIRQALELGDGLGGSAHSPGAVHELGLVGREHRGLQ